MQVLERWKTLLCLLVAVTIPVVAQADPVAITSGTVLAWWDNSLTSTSLSGPTVVVTGNGRGAADAGWDVGTTGDLDGSWVFESRLDSGGRVEIGGTVYPNVFLDASGLLFDTPSFVVPPSGPLQARFTASGHIVGHARPWYDPAGQGPALFDFEVTGTGIASILPFVVPGHGVLLNRSQVRYVFDEGPAPVAEPATMLLIGSGLAGLVRLRRRVA